ncbi:MAG TPA: sialate O-acetylesterase, partial [Tepidisphaeraceae bacterium]|nr:sialate O-acetylesterase [Tepidisphaeraceae bacterium]
MPVSKYLAAVIVSIIAPLAMRARADVTPASPFTDHMVLQRDMPVPVWGTAPPGEHVTVTIGTSTKGATAGEDMRWMLRLPPLNAGGPYEMTITGSGGSVIALKDVLIGEVWLCSGQSNMDFTVARMPKYYFAGTRNEAEEVAAADYPQIRMFSGHWRRSYTPQVAVPGEWRVCTPQNVREFSAVGYFFARDLHKALNVPVGIVTETYGASTAEAWISREALAADPQLKPILDGFDAKATTYPSEQRVKDLEALGHWEAEMAKLDPTTRPIKAPPNHDPANDQHNPTVLFNGMIAPIIPYAIRGVLWYQGESIVGGANGVKLYPLVQRTLVNDWRQRWGEGDFPFYIVQLAAYKAPATQPVQNSGIANVRAAQQTILSLPNTGMAITIDIGDAKNIHPKDKQDVGDRLTRIALAKTYGQPIEYSGPIYESMAVEGNTIRVKFTHTTGGLVARGGPLKQFAIAGKDGQFVWADAKIDGDSVIVSSDRVSDP